MEYWDQPRRLISIGIGDDAGGENADGRWRLRQGALRLVTFEFTVKRESFPTFSYKSMIRNIETKPLRPINGHRSH